MHSAPRAMAFAELAEVLDLAEAKEEETQAQEDAGADPASEDEPAEAELLAAAAETWRRQPAEAEFLAAAEEWRRKSLIGSDAIPLWTAPTYIKQPADAEPKQKSEASTPAKKRITYIDRSQILREITRDTAPIPPVLILPAHATSRLQEMDTRSSVYKEIRKQAKKSASSRAGPADR